MQGKKVNFIDHTLQGIDTKRTAQITCKMKII